MKKRIASVDIMRALTMLMMLFVNDFAGMTGIPHRMHHAAMTEDMLGFSDLVFPAFLFCVGLSIPLAVANRYRKGDSPLRVILHIIERSVALIIMGLFAMNMGGVEGGLSGNWYTLLCVCGFFLVWNAYPSASEGRSHWWAIALKWLGIALLVALMLYKDLNGIHFKVGWWGILGLIGWAYLVCSLAYVFIGGGLRNVAIAWIVTVALCLLNSLECIPADSTVRWLFLSFVPGGWTQHALVMSGVLASSLMLRAESDGKPLRLEACLWGLGVVMLICGIVSHRFWIISKILATPTWLFFCTAIFFPLFAIIYWVADVKGRTAWARPISPAGTATLTCYSVPYIWYAIQGLIGFEYPAFLYNGVPGLLKALVFGFVIIGITWCLGKLHIKMKV